MNSIQFESLLNESESSSLDFKRDQYCIGKSATDDVRSTVIKDILAMANSFRRSDAYIVVGVKSQLNGGYVLHGVSDHIDDASLQQFVNSKTNRAVDFVYKPVQYHGLMFGVVCIPKQVRPLFLNKSFGSIDAGEVWYRRGSSNTVASPDVVASMGSDDSADGSGGDPVVSVGVQLDDSLDVRTGPISLETTTFDLVNTGEYSDFKDVDQEPSSFSGSSIFGYRGRSANKDYYKEAAEYVLFHSLLKPYCFVVSNKGPAAAIDVELVIKGDSSEKFFGYVDEPAAPTMYRYPLNPPVFPTPRVARRLSKRIFGNKWECRISCGDLSSGDTFVTREPIYLGWAIEGKLNLQVKVLAKNIKIPQFKTIYFHNTIESHPELTEQMADELYGAIVDRRYDGEV